MYRQIDICIDRSIDRLQIHSSKLIDRQLGSQIDYRYIYISIDRKIYRYIYIQVDVQIDVQIDRYMYIVQIVPQIDYRYIAINRQIDSQVHRQIIDTYLQIERQIDRYIYIGRQLDRFIAIDKDRRIDGLDKQFTLSCLRDGRGICMFQSLSN